jgi:hypothetical protein
MSFNLPSLAVRESVSSWHTASTASKYVHTSLRSHCISNSNRRRDIAHEAYCDAIEYLERELADGGTRQLFSTSSTVEDIHAAVEAIKAKYESKAGKKKGLKWLSRFSGKIMYYSQVLDMLSQHHPEYVALGWGSIKFVLMVGIGYIPRSTMHTENQGNH